MEQEGIPTDSVGSQVHQLEGHARQWHPLLPGTIALRFLTVNKDGEHKMIDNALIRKMIADIISYVLKKLMPTDLY